MAGRGRGLHALPPLFCIAKRKKENKEKKETVSKQKRLSPSQNVSALGLERLEFKHFFCQPTMVVDNAFQCSMATPL